MNLHQARSVYWPAKGVFPYSRLHEKFEQYHRLNKKLGGLPRKYNKSVRRYNALLSRIIKTLSSVSYLRQEKKKFTVPKISKKMWLHNPGEKFERCNLLNSSLLFRTRYDRKKPRPAKWLSRSAYIRYKKAYMAAHVRGAFLRHRRCVLIKAFLYRQRVRHGLRILSFYGSKHAGRLFLLPCSKAFSDVNFLTRHNKVKPDLAPVSAAISSEVLMPQNRVDTMKAGLYGVHV